MRDLQDGFARLGALSPRRRYPDSSVLGRTNRSFPPTWLRLELPARSSEIDELVAAALASGSPLDVTSSPALWGGKMRGTDAVLACMSSAAYEHATDGQHAIDLMQAHLIETLSCIGREHFDFYFLRIRKMVEEYQLSGALEALEGARQEGHIRHVGLFCDGPALSSLAQWQFNDAFEVLLADDAALETLKPLADQRRVGVIGLNSPGSEYRLMSVRSAAEVEALTR